MGCFGKSLAGAGYVVLNIIRVLNIISLLAVIAGRAVGEVLLERDRERPLLLSELPLSELKLEEEEMLELDKEDEMLELDNEEERIRRCFLRFFLQHLLRHIRYLGDPFLLNPRHLSTLSFTRWDES